MAEKMLRSVNFLSPRFWLALILTVGAAFRLYHLGHESLWIDEIYAFRVAAGTLRETILYQDVHPPLFYVLVHYWMKLFGGGEAALRMLSLLFGMGTIWMVYRLGRELFGSTAGIFAALLVSLSSFHVTYSQEARSYTMFSFFGATSFYYYVRVLAQGRSRDWVGYVIATLLTLYTHNFSVWAVIFQNVFSFTLLFTGKNKNISWVSWILAQALMFIVFLPWFMTCLINSGSVKDSFWIGRPTVGILKDTFRDFAGGGYSLLVLATAILLAFFFWWKDRQKLRESFLLCLGWIVISLALPYVVSLVWTPMYYIRYTILSSIPFYLLAGSALAQIRPLSVRVATTCLVTIMLVSSLAIYHSLTRKEEWRQAIQYMDAASLPEDLVVFHLSGNHIYKYYSKNKDRQLETFPLRAAEGIIQEHEKRVTRENIASLDELILGRRRVWLVLSHTRDAEGLLVQRLSEMMTCVRHQKFYQVEVYLFEK